MTLGLTKEGCGTAEVTSALAKRLGFDSGETAAGDAGGVDSGLTAGGAPGLVSAEVNLASEGAVLAADGGI